MTNMQLQEIPRTAVRMYLHTARLPVTAAAALLRRADQEDWPPALAFESFGASLKQIVGSVLRDEELVHEGRLTQAKVGRLREAIELESIAQQHEAKADAQFRERHETNEHRRDQVERQAAEREAALQRQKTEEKQRADNKARKEAEAAREAETATQKAVAKQDRAARSTRVSVERDALAEERRAGAAKRKVTRIDKELAATKATRKND